MARLNVSPQYPSAGSSSSAASVPGAGLIRCSGRPALIWTQPSDRPRRTPSIQRHPSTHDEAVPPPDALAFPVCLQPERTR